MSTQNSSKKNINLYVNTESGSNDLINASTYEDYIINQNKILNTKIHEVLIENNTLQTKVNEMEEECDKYQRQSINMRGFMKNLVELKKLHQEKADIHIKFNKETKTILEIQKWNYVKLFVTVFTCVLSLFLFLSLLGFVRFTTIVRIVATDWTIFYATFIMFKNLQISANKNNYTIRLNEINNEINELKKGQDFLDEYIDNI
jgi:hypothetical protein